MTEEQIRQNAVKYSEQHCSGYVDGSLVDSYIAGAHSRDEEIENLQIDMYGLQGSVDLWKGEAGKANSKIRKLEKELDKLRNPWISVEDRLPEEGQDVLICNWVGKVIRNDYISKGDIDYMKEHPEMYTSWMLTPKPQIEKGE